MNILVIYISPNTTTEKISRALRQRLALQGHTLRLLNIGKPGNRKPEEIAPQVFEGVDLLGIGSPVFHMRTLAPLETFLELALPRMRPARAFLYLTYGGITSGKAFLNMARLLKRQQVALVGGFKVWAPHFYHHVSYPDAAALHTLDAFCARLAERQFQPLPWERVERLFSAQTWRVNAVYPLTHWIGRLRELPIRIDGQRCAGCGRCVKECPTGALALVDGAALRSARQCLYCYHCTTACTRNAILCPTEKVEAMLRVNKKVIGCEQPVNAVYF